MYIVINIISKILNHLREIIKRTSIKGAAIEMSQETDFGQLAIIITCYNCLFVSK